MIRLVEMTHDDVRDLFALTQRVDPYGVPHVEWLRSRTLGDPTCSPDLLLLARSETQIVGCCLACIRGERGVVKLFGVEPMLRRRGIGKTLFDTLENRLWARGIREVAVEGAAPNLFLPGVSLDKTDAICFLLKRGYETDRVARVDMEVALAAADLDTASAEAGLRRQGITIRRARSEDIDPAASMALAHFSEAWRYEVADTAHYTPTPLFIALHEGRIVSFAAYEVSGPARFGPTGTDPAYRKRGIGSVLLKLCLCDMRDRGDRVGEIGWVGPIGFYARAVGARISRAYWCFQKSLVGGDAG